MPHTPSDLQGRFVKLLPHLGVSRRAPVYAGSTFDPEAVYMTAAAVPARTRRRQRPRLTRNVRIRTVEQSVPTLGQPARASGHPDTLPYDSPRATGAITGLTEALHAQITPRAYRLYAVVLLTLPRDEWLSSDQMATAAGVTEHAVRPLLGELVSTGLLVKKRKVVGREKNGQAKVRSRYYARPVSA